MRASEFARRRARIDHRDHGDGNRSRKARRALLKRARAIRVIRHGRVVAYRMRDGSVACVKERFRSEATATHEIGRIAETSLHAYIPVRAYLCDLCSGWHLTSRA